MHTQAQPINELFPPAPTLAERRQIARFHAALFPTRLALARWQNGGHLPHLHGGEPALRAAWFAAARRDFQAWLERGGFSQHEDLSVPAASSLESAALSSTPAPVPDGDARQVGTC